LSKDLGENNFEMNASVESSGFEDMSAFHGRKLEKKKRNGERALAILRECERKPNLKKISG
jgi:hypothetical protein